jgi:hypothetical protein
MPCTLDSLIEELFASDADRALARAWARKLDADGLEIRNDMRAPHKCTVDTLISDGAMT